MLNLLLNFVPRILNQLAIITLFGKILTLFSGNVAWNGSDEENGSDVSDACGVPVDTGSMNGSDLNGLT